MKKRLIREGAFLFMWGFFGNKRYARKFVELTPGL
jgi:hypothetical protein